MNSANTLSKREQQYQFTYLLAMALLVIGAGIYLISRRFATPLSGNDVLEIQMLAERNKFSRQQYLVFPLIHNAYKKIHILNDSDLHPFAAHDIKNSINAIANSFENSGIYDSRKEGYIQMAQFYKMYLEDKIIAVKKMENITLFEKQYEECAIGFKDKEQQLAQKKNAILSRSVQ